MKNIQGIKNNLPKLSIYKILLILSIFLLIFQNQFYWLKPKKEISPLIEQRLSELGKKALLSNDVPVAAIITYNDSIVGEGFNKVIRDSNISAHAEIIALNQVFKNANNTFSKLDREKLVLYSTFEPCEMCKGAILHYNIKNISFEQSKPIFRQTKSLLKTILYNFSIERIDSPELQESLFLEHPGYNKSR